MANDMEILQKIYRNLKQMGYTVSMSGASVVVDNASNDLTVTYVAASIQGPMGGVSDAAAPYLGIGVGNPGVIKVTSAINTSGDMTDILDSATSAQVLAVVSSFANDVLLSNSDGSFTADVRGHSDLRGLGM